MSGTAGRFITVEGIDGAGKTTAVRHLGEVLRGRGIPVITTREPGGTQLAEAIRGLLKGADGEAPGTDTETLLMFAARAQHLEAVIRPALAAGQWVVCDRFTDATYAYQGGGRGMSAERIRVLEEWVQAGLQPDRTLLFEIPAAQGLRRREGEGRGSDRFEGEGLAFLESVQAAYRAKVEEDPGRFRVLDAARDWAAVAADLDAWLDAEIGLWRGGSR